MELRGGSPSNLRGGRNRCLASIFSGYSSRTPTDGSIVFDGRDIPASELLFDDDDIGGDSFGTTVGGRATVGACGQGKVSKTDSGV